MPTQSSAFFYGQLIGSALQGGVLVNSAETCLLVPSSIGTLGSGQLAAVTLQYFFRGVVYFQANAGANWSVDLRYSTGTPLNAWLKVGQDATFAVKAAQGSPAYYNNSVTVDGAAPAQIQWIGGAPTAGNASGTDFYLYNVTKTADRTFNVFGSLTQFKT